MVLVVILVKFPFFAILLLITKANLMEAKFKVGDEVVIVKYGHHFWSYEPVPGCNFPVLYDNKEEGYKVYDMSPELVGQKGIIDQVTNTQGMWKYAINGPNKHAWYDEKQLEKVLPTPEDKRFRGYGTSKKKTDRAGR
jgi:hypothetical protein